VCFVGQRKAEKQFNGSQGVSEKPSNLAKATLLKRKAGVSGMRRDEVVDHPFLVRVDKRNGSSGQEVERG